MTNSFKSRPRVALDGCVFHRNATVGKDAPFAPLDHLLRCISARATRLGGFHRLGVDNARGRDASRPVRRIVLVERARGDTLQASRGRSPEPDGRR
jgi:hypothetical protein